MNKYFIYTSVAIILLSGFSLHLYHPLNSDTYSSIASIVDIIPNTSETFYLTEKTEQQIENFSSTPEIAKKTYNILLVPGHEPTTGGAIYKNVKEREMNVRVAEAIASELKDDSRFRVVVARNLTSWHPVLANYFKSQSTEIKAFIKKHSEIMNVAIKSGQITKVDNVYHNKANAEAVLHLFGLNKIVNDQEVDAVIHIHFNDYPRRKTDKPGKETGFAIYIPEKQFKNSISSLQLAQSIFPEINKILSTSTLPQEKAGIVEDQDLIAIGSNNTLIKPSILIEYGYIYESIFSTKAKREEYYKQFGQVTASGLINYFKNISNN